jgi:RNA polymerase sigma factor (sigma-70 family)
MADRQINSVLQYSRRLAAGPEAGTDAQLLDRFANRRDEAAFTALVGRHGPMVLALSRRILHDRQDAEDVFQAAFLVLARKAPSIRQQESIGGWLYRVAFRLALRTRADAVKRRGPGGQESGTIKPSGTGAQPVAQAGPLAEISWREVRTALDEELARLPDRWRAPLVLCYLEGKTQDEALQQLGWSKSTFRRRLEEGRKRLCSRLTRRGVTLSAGLWATLLSDQVASAAILSPLSQSTVQAAMAFAAGEIAGAAVSPQVILLVKEGLKVTAMSKMKWVAVIGLVTALTTGIGLAAHPALTVNEGTEEPKALLALADEPRDQAKPDKVDQARVDHYGDLLPAGALARLGTARFRHGDLLSSISISPDGQQIVSQSDLVRVWEAATGKELRHFTLLPALGWPGRRLGSGSLSPDGKVLAVGGQWAESDPIVLCEVATGRKLKEFGKGQYEVVSFSPDGKTLGAIASRRGRVELWDVATGQRLHAWDAHGQAYSVAFARDGKTLLTHGRDKRVCFWDVDTGRLTREIKDCPTVWNFQDPQRQVAISPEGSLLAAIRPKESNEMASVNQIDIWDVATGKELRQLSVPKQEVPEGDWTAFRAVAWGADGQLVTAGPDSSVRIWDPATARVLRRIPWGGSSWELALSRDGKHIATAPGGQTVRLIDLTKDQASDPFANLGAPGPPGEVAVSSGLAVTTHGYAMLWDAATGKELRRLEHPSGIARVHLSADGRVLFAACGDNILRAWDTGTGQEKRDFELKNGSLGPLRAVLGDAATTLALAPDGKVLLAAARPNAQIDVWNAVTGKIARTFKGRQCYVYGLAFTPEARTLVICFEDRTVEVWDVATGEKLRQFPLPEDKENAVPGRPVFTAALSPDGSLLAFGSQDRFLVLKDMVTGQDIRRLDKLPDGVFALAFSPDGKTLAWAGWQDPTVHLVEVFTGRERCTLHGHGGRVLPLAFSGDGKRLISAGNDTTALIWDLTGRLSAGDRWGKPLPPKEIEAAWVDLRSDEAARAYQAICRLAGSPTEAISFLQKRLQPVAAVDQKRMDGLIADLDSRSFAVREAASKELEKLAEIATLMCRKALEGKPSAEMRRRLQALLEQQARDWQNPSPERFQVLRAVEALEHIGSSEAQKVLQDLARGASGAWLTQEAKASLKRLNQRAVTNP